MKKKLIMALAAVAMTAGFAAKADNCCNQRRHCNDNDRHCTQPCDVNANRCDSAACCPGACPFDDLGLTDAQKQQLKDLRTRQAEARKSATRNAKQLRKDARSDSRRAELAEIKKILTPEQYVKFLEGNFVDRKQEPQPRRADARRMAPRKDARPAKRAEAVKATEATKK